MCQIVKNMPANVFFVFNFIMKKKLENVLIFAATSDMAKPLIKKLLAEGCHIYAASRSNLDFEDKNLFKFHLDLSLEENINDFFRKLPNEIAFDSVINFQGVAISSPVEFLDRKSLEYQLNISLFSLLCVLKNLRGKIKKDGHIINISSMASFGIYPFLSPYSIAKASSDILLNCYEIETGIKTVSIKPGVVGTKFWEYCVKENRENFEKFPFEYEKIGKFLKENAIKNSNKGIKPVEVSNLIYKILYKRNTKSSYLIGSDSYFASFVSKFKGRTLFKLIRKILDKRQKRALK